jgi:hypothetical protein
MTEMVLIRDVERAQAIIIATQDCGCPLTNIHANFGTLFFSLATHRNWNGGPYRAANDGELIRQHGRGGAIRLLDS